MIDPKIIYKKDLIDAIKRSEQKSIEVPEFYFESNGLSLLSNDKINKLLDFCNSQVYCNPIEEIAGKCLDWNVKLQEQISSILNCDVLLTFGYIETHESNFFFTPLEEMNTWFKPETIMKPLNQIHAWITLPSLEIIDMTVFASGEYININSTDANRYKNCHFVTINNFNESFIYKPMFVGIDFLFKTKMALKVIET